LLATAPDEAAGWAIMAADAFGAAGDPLGAGWAHLNAAFALTAAGRSGPARVEQDRARELLDTQSPALFPLLRERTGPVAARSAPSTPGPTRRERAVLALLADGLTAVAIARKLTISPRTVHHHLENLYRKLGTSDRLATVLRAKTLGLV
jgi:DNA-binding NarL/FixJ family response regulator